MEERIIELETKLAFQDDTILKLEAEVNTQAQQIFKLQKEFTELRKHITSGENAQIMKLEDEAPPPHY
jgi:SlyX protein